MLTPLELPFLSLVIATKGKRKKKKKKEGLRREKELEKCLYYLTHVLIARLSPEPFLSHILCIKPDKLSSTTDKPAVNEREKGLLARQLETLG